MKMPRGWKNQYVSMWDFRQTKAKLSLSKLNHLLDLKQKQANLDEAASASEEAQIAAIQNQAVLVFTVVTVIFVSSFHRICP
jgi:hypothetical protein